MRKKLYVASPISKGDVATNVIESHKAGMALLQAGFAPLVPHGNCFWGNHLSQCPDCKGVTFHPEATHSGITHATWLDIDLPWVAVADGVLRLPGESVGADREAEFAKSKGIPVFTSIEDAVQHFAAKKQGAADATARPTDAGAAANGAAGGVGDGKKAPAASDLLRYGMLLTAAEDMIRRVCQHMPTVKDGDTSGFIATVTAIRAAIAVFVEFFDKHCTGMSAEEYEGTVKLTRRCVDDIADHYMQVHKGLLAAVLAAFGK